jgi:hypothetical protein
LHTINKAQKVMTKKWLTPEQAIVKANLTVTPETLKSYIAEQQGKTTAEEQFQALGLLFDRERWCTGKPNFLQLLEPVSDENNYTDDEIDSYQLDGDEIETSATNRVNQLEPFIFDQCKVKIVITLLPTQQAGDRPVIIAASSHGDFPVVTMLNQEELGDLPPAIVQLLEELKADLPNRQIRRNIAAASTHDKWGQPSSEVIVGSCGSNKQGCPHLSRERPSQTQSVKTNKPHIPQTPIRSQTTSSDNTNKFSNTTQISLF